MFHAIIASVSEHVTPFIASTTTSHEAWTKLIRLYANGSHPHIMSLKDRLSKPRDSNPLAECLMTIKTTSDELALIDVPILEDNLGLYILNGIGENSRRLLALFVLASPSFLLRGFMTNFFDHEAFLEKEVVQSPYPVISANSTHRTNTSS